MIVVVLAAMTLPVQASSSWKDTPSVEGLSGAEVRAVEVTSDGSVWLGVRDRGLARLRGEHVNWYGTDDGLVTNGVASLHEDVMGRLWAAGVGGFSVLEHGRWVAHQMIGPLQPRVVFSISEEPRTGVIWLAANGGAGQKIDGAWHVVRPTDGLPHEVVHAVVVDLEAAAWLACRRGLARVANDRVSVFFPDVNFRAAAITADGTLWFGTSDGIYTWDGTSWGRHLEGTAAYPLLVTESGMLWAGSLGSGILRFDGDRWESVELPSQFRDAEVFDLAEAPDGLIWVATSAGAARYDPVLARDRF